MTYKEFRKQARQISREQFKGLSFHPLEHGIERGRFEENKFKRLIRLAKETPCETTRRQIERWERQIARLQETRRRLEKAKAGIFGDTAPAPEFSGTSIRRRPAVIE